MRYVFVIIAVLLVTHVTVHAEQAAGGRVLTTRGDLTVVKLADGKWQEGGRVDLGFETPDGEYIPAGSWCVHMIEQRTPPTFVMSLRKIDAYAEPTVGYTAKAVLLQGDELTDWLEHAARAGCADAQLNLGMKLYYNDDSELSKRGFTLVQSAAEQGYPDAMVEFGNMSAQQINKEGGADSFSNANKARFKWSLRAAQAGFAPAMISVCSDLLWGATGEFRVEEGKKWCRKAAEAQNTPDYIREDALKKLRDYEKFQQGVQERIKNMNR